MGSMDLALVLAEFSPIVLATLDGRLMVPLGTIEANNRHAVEMLALYVM